MSTKLLAFLEGYGVDETGRTHAQILALSDSEFESEHDSLLWLFPLEESPGVHCSFDLSKSETTIIWKNAKIRAHMLLALARVREFYLKNDHWLVPANHNHAFITRILHSVDLLISEKEAHAFLSFIMHRVHESGNRVNAKTITAWKKASDI